MNIIIVLSFQFYIFLILIPTYSPILGTAEGLNQIMAHLLHKRSLFTIILVPIWYLFFNKTGPYSLYTVGNYIQANST